MKILINNYFINFLINKRNNFLNFLRFFITMCIVFFFIDNIYQILLISINIKFK